MADEHKHEDTLLNEEVHEHEHHHHEHDEDECDCGCGHVQTKQLNVSYKWILKG